MRILAHTFLMSSEYVCLFGVEKDGGRWTERKTESKTESGQKRARQTEGERESKPDRQTDSE